MKFGLLRIWGLPRNGEGVESTGGSFNTSANSMLHPVRSLFATCVNSSRACMSMRSLTEKRRPAYSRNPLLGSTKKQRRHEAICCKIRPAERRVDFVLRSFMSVWHLTNVMPQKALSQLVHSAKYESPRPILHDHRGPMGGHSSATLQLR